MENSTLLKPNRKKGGYFKFFILLLVTFAFLSLFASQASAQEGDIAELGAAGGLWQLKDIPNPIGMAADLVGAVALMPVYGLVAVIQSFATTIFRWIIKPENIRYVLGADSNYLYAIWAIVRDFLNLGFILALLFIAFSTIFHIEKYSYKKLLWRLIIMALLVNFSYSIARFIIDISNVLMYTLVDMLFAGGTDGFGKSLVRFEYLVNFNKIWVSGTSATGDLLIAIIFGFIFAMTLLVVAMMFVIRMIALAILIIFSPVAFVASIIPSTAGYADKWWTNLFKYAFFAPIMIFMIFVSIKMTEALAANMQGQVAGYPKVDAIATAEASAQKAGTVAQLAVAAIPIVLLWMGMGMAQSMSIAGAGAVLKGVKGAGKSISGLGAAQRTWTAIKARRDEGRKTGRAARIGTSIGTMPDKAKALIGGRAGREAQIRLDRDRANRIKAESESRDMKNMEVADLRNLVNDPASSQNVKAAAVQALSEKASATEADMDQVRTTFGETSQVFRQLVDNVKKYDPGAAFSHIADDSTRATAMGNAMVGMDINKINASAWNAGPGGIQGQEMMRVAFERGLLKSGDVEKIAEKSTAHRDAITDSLGHVASTAGDQTNEIHRNIQLAHLGRKGELSSAVVGQTWKEEVYKRSDKNTLSRLTAAQAKADRGVIISSVNPGKFKDSILEMKDTTARDTLLHHARTQVMPTSANRIASSNQAIASKDPQISLF